VTIFSSGVDSGSSTVVDGVKNDVSRGVESLEKEPGGPAIGKGVAASSEV
jgi:hypothetical protein